MRNVRIFAILSSDAVEAPFARNRVQRLFFLQSASAEVVVLLRSPLILFRYVWTKAIVNLRREDVCVCRMPSVRVRFSMCSIQHGWTEQYA